MAKQPIAEQEREAAATRSNHGLNQSYGPIAMTKALVNNSEAVNVKGWSEKRMSINMPRVNA
jgi:hypothetical protein